MFKNYFITAVNHLLNDKLFSFINILGLAVGLAACITISLYVFNELSFDRHWDQADQIYRVNQETYFSGSSPSKLELTSLGILPALSDYFPTQIESGTRMRQENSVDLKVGNNLFTDQFVRVDPEFKELFQLDVLAGSLEATFANINTIALSEELAYKMFGDENPIGRIISIPQRFVFPERDHRVTAVYRFKPGNTLLKANALVLLDDIDLPDFVNSWRTNTLVTYVKLAKSADINEVQTRLDNFTDEHAVVPQGSLANNSLSPSDAVKIRLQPISDIYFNPWSDRDEQNAGDYMAVSIFSFLAVLVLMTGCINFMTLTLAKSTRRAREISMRKVVGAKRQSLIFQFFGETLLLTVVATLLGLGLLEAVLPVYQKFTGQTLTLNYKSSVTYIFLLTLICFVTLIGGIYPALVMSGFKPIKSLSSGKASNSTHTTLARNSLVVFQFSVSIVLIVATAFVFLQSRFASTNNLGFNPSNLLVLGQLPRSQSILEGIDAEGARKRSLLKQEIDLLPMVINSTLSYSRPADTIGVQDNISIPMALRSELDANTPESQRISFRLTPIDEQFFNTYEISLLAGRHYNTLYARDIVARDTDTLVTGSEQGYRQNNLIINATAASRLGFADPQDALGNVLRGYYPYVAGGVPVDYTIVGVVGDSLFFNARADTAPEVYPLDPGIGLNLSIRYRGDSQEALEAISEVWTNTMSDNDVLKPVFVEGLMRQQFSDLTMQSSMLGGFSALTIILACLGLLGISIFNVERRTKEIGLRKVMGAKIRSIMALLLWQFSKPVLLANLFAYPIAIYVMHSWLENFSNRIDTLWLIPLCISAGLISLIFVWTIVVCGASSIVRKTPIHALRYE